jgi:hypothetical protein
MQKWYELEDTVENLVLTDNSDALVWSYNSLVEIVQYL